MGVTIVERLFSEGNSVPVDDFIRVMGGLDPSDKVKAYRANSDGQMQVEVANNAATVINNTRSGLTFPIFDRKQVYAKDTIFFTEALVGGGTSTYSTNDAAVQMGVTAASGDKVTRQTRIYIPSEIGWTQLVIIGGLFNSAKANLRQRIGVNSDNNGFFFELNGTTLNVVRRTNTSGSPVDTAVAQAAWNVDVMDGSGPSGLTLDITKIQSFIISYDWLLGARMCIGFLDQVVTVHQFESANILTVPIVRSPVLPIRWEIENTGATSGASTMLQHGAAVFTAGAADFSGLVTTASNGVTGRNVGSGSFLPIISVRLKSVYNRGILQPIGFETLVTANRSMHYQLRVGGTLTGPSWTSLTDATEYDVSATAHSGGILVKAGYVAGASRGSEPELKVPFLAGLDLSGNNDIITLLLQTISGTANNTYAALTFREII